MVDPDAHERLDRAFLALADPVLRRLIKRLSRGPASVNELAEPFAITKQAVSKHIQVLERAGLATRTREAQRRPIHLDARALKSLTSWTDTYRCSTSSSSGGSTRCSPPCPGPTTLCRNAARRKRDEQ